MCIYSYVINTQKLLNLHFTDFIFSLLVNKCFYSFSVFNEFFFIKYFFSKNIQNKFIFSNVSNENY